MIPIKNIYYMLSYAFTELDKKTYEKLSYEEFDNILELLSEILILGVSKELKRGINRSYNLEVEELSTLRGKIDITSSINPYINHRRLVCDYDEFTVNSYKNRIIKTTMYYLLKSSLSANRKKKLRKLSAFFTDVDLLDFHHINWNLKYDRNNQTYILLINICYLIISGFLPRKEEGTCKLIIFNEEYMPRLYEKFLLEYYRKEHPEVKAESSYINWQLDDDNSYLLPSMHTDITLSQDNNILIIDAKYYGKTLEEHFDKKKISSNNLYQIFTYVKNKEFELMGVEHCVSGMLLYARTDEEIQPDNTYHMSGNMISVRTLDLNKDFTQIKEQLDSIVEEFLTFI